LFVRPEAIRRWHRALVAGRWTYRRTTPPGRPVTNPSIRELVVRIARENPAWGYRRIHGRILRRAGIDPAPRRASESWRAFLRVQASGIIACDFLTVDTVLLRRLYVLVFIHLATRKALVAGVTANPTGACTTQRARNSIEALTNDRDAPIRFVVRDRDTKFTTSFDDVFKSEGIHIVRTPVQAPKANAFAERLVGTIRRDCLDRILIVNRRHLERVLCTYIDHYNTHRPHRSLDQRPPALPSAVPPPPGNPANVRRRDRLGGLIHEYETAA
jgi:putative transposase